MANFTKGIFAGSFMLISALGFSQNSLKKASTEKESYIQKYVSQKEFKFSEGDLNDLVVTDEYFSKSTGLTHIYLQQRYQGIPIHNVISSVSTKDNTVFYFGNKFLHNIADRVNVVSPSLTPLQAVEKVASNFNLGAVSSVRSLSARGNGYLFSAGNLSEREIPVKLTYVVMESGALRLAWDVEVEPKEGIDAWSVRVDAITGEVLDTHNFTIACSFENPNYGEENLAHNHSQEEVINRVAEFDIFKPNTSIMVDGSQYQVFALPIESPLHGSRTIVKEPADLNSSPFGWHDTDGRAGAEYTITRGNNVYAYLDISGNNRGDSSDGGSKLSFVNPYSSNQQPSSYKMASVDNLFYMNNMMHDIWYVSGFDEVSGNFQENNYGKGGRGGDSVNAEAQDGSGENNANMMTYPDGQKPRMQMYLWNGNPKKDGSLDNGIVAHEYGHGISTRLAGGPSTSECLSGAEQMGEGWSDWFGLMITMKPGDSGTDKRGIGTYALNQSTTGVGIRAKAYSTDFRINNFTYNSIKSQVAPHGVGSVWATMLWDLTWAYVDKYGWSADLVNGKAGNNKLMQLVLDGLKLQPCNSGFVDSRDAILAADRATTGGQDACMIWQVFAKRGLGYSANQGSSGKKNDGSEAFDLPKAGLTITANADTCGSQVPQVLVTNFTKSQISTINYTYSIDGGASRSGTWTGNVGSCESASITIDDLGNLSRGSHLLEFKTVNPAGSASQLILINDKGVEDVVNTFENDSDVLIAYDDSGASSLWERGNAAGNVLSSAVAKGSKVYGTNLSGKHGNMTTAYLVSQCYDLSKLNNTFVKFDMAFDLEPDYDIVYVEYSKDGGEEWKILGDANSPDWYNSSLVPDGTQSSCSVCVGGQWTRTNATMKEYKHSLAAFDKNGSAEKSMLFRLVLKSDPQEAGEGAIVDNFVITGDSDLSTADTEFEGLNFFPNPTTGVVTIQSATSLKDAKVTIHDIMGRALTNGVSVNAIDTNRIRVDISQFATGAYFLSIENNSRKSTRRIIKN